MIDPYISAVLKVILGLGETGLNHLGYPGKIPISEVIHSVNSARDLL